MNLNLDKEFGDMVKSLLSKCHEQGVVMVPYDGLRSPGLQARFWMQGRSAEEINKAIHKLKKENALYLASCLENNYVLSPEKSLVTNALPGCSWHQWGEALDCYWLYNDTKIWDISIVDIQTGISGYEVYGREARAAGINAGFFWQNLKDATHIQKQQLSSPLELYSYQEINEIMKEFYSS